MPLNADFLFSLQLLCISSRELKSGAWNSSFFGEIPNQLNHTGIFLRKDCDVCRASGPLTAPEEEDPKWFERCHEI